MMEMEQYLEVFVEETKEHLQSMTESLLELEKNPDSSKMVDEIFRSAHTLKGMSGTMGFENMTRLTHQMENALDVIRNEKNKPDSDIVDMFFKCMDVLEEYLSNITNTGLEGENTYNAILNKLGEFTGEDSLDNNQSENGTDLLKIDRYENKVLKTAVDMGKNIFIVTVVLDKECVMKSARSFIVFQIIEKYSEIIKAVPPVEDIEDEKFDFSFKLIIISNKDRDFIKKKINSISEIKKVIVENFDADRNFQTREDFSKDSVSDKSDNNGDDRNKSFGKALTKKTVRVDIKRLDMLMNLVSELIIQKTRLQGLKNMQKSQDFNEVVEYLERITISLHDAVMRVRMVPVEKVFNRFPRMIRDVSKELNKKIDLIMSGEETELDRTEIDEIGDPLIHLLRNAADHGIETVEERRKLGKSDKGTVYLRAYQDGNNVVIEVEDDGRGIDVEKVRKKAVENRLIREEHANDLSGQEVLNFIFTPNFSTSEKVTDLSGRGVGMDVVKTKIENLSGKIEIESKKGEGTKFVIRLPLTLAIIQALLVQVGNEKYAIPLNSVNRIVKLPPDNIKTAGESEVVLVQGMVVPIIRLNEVLNIETEEKDRNELKIIVVRKGEKSYGFLVDSILSQQEIVVKSTGRLLKDIKYIAGATILGDGSVAMILDINFLT